MAEKVNDCIATDLNSVISHLREHFNDTPDLIFREFGIKQTGEQGLLVFMDGLSDKNAINHDILRPLQFEEGSGQAGGKLIMNVGHIMTVETWMRVEQNLLNGFSTLFVDGRTEAYSLDTRGWPQRAIEDPQMESSLKGAHQALLRLEGKILRSFAATSPTAN